MVRLCRWDGVDSGTVEKDFWLLMTEAIALKSKPWSLVIPADGDGKESSDSDRLRFRNMS